jgi:hypothetical protein
MVVPPRRYSLVCNGVSRFMDGATMTQIRAFPGVVTSDGRAETRFGTFEFKDAPPWPAGTLLDMYVHFRKGTLSATSVEEMRAYLVEDKADTAARRAAVRAANNIWRAEKAARDAAKLAAKEERARKRAAKARNQQATLKPQ